MTKSTKNQAPATRLLPTVVSKGDIGSVAFDGQRRRPVLAINDDGDLVVCCRATARTHGWEVQGSLHTRPDAGTAPKGAPKRRADDGQQRRETDKAGTVVLPAKAVKELKSTISAAAATLGMDDLLATK
jgi:hypothetical protein